jgi:N-acetylneuraminate synthase/sialic acid synthase
MGKKLVAARDLPAGHVLTADDIDAKSPGDGLPPFELPRLIGRALRESVAADSALHFGLLEEAPASELAEVMSGDGRG